MRSLVLLAALVLTACQTTGIDGGLQAAFDKDWPGPRAFQEEEAFAAVVNEAAGEAFGAVGLGLGIIAGIGSSPEAIGTGAVLGAAIGAPTNSEEARAVGTRATTLAATALDTFDALMDRYDREALAVIAEFQSGSLTPAETDAHLTTIAARREQAIERARDIDRYLERSLKSVAAVDTAADDDDSASEDELNALVQDLERRRRAFALRITEAVERGDIITGRLGQ